MSTKSKAYLVGGGIGSLAAAAAFMIRDGGLPGENISILEAASVLGGSLDGAGDPAVGYSLRGGRMLTTDNYECTWDLFKSIPSLNDEGKTVFDETVEFNERHKSHSMARLVGGTARRRRPGLRQARRNWHRVRKDVSWQPVPVLFTRVPRQVRRLARPVSDSPA